VGENRRAPYVSSDGAELLEVSAICTPEVVYSMVYNSYFLMLFARYEDPGLREELELVGAK
jgi:hypothetical protein